MLQFICNTGGEAYQAEIEFPRKVFYIYEGREIEIEKIDQDCEKCKEELDSITASAREKARQELRQKNLK